MAPKRTSKHSIIWGRRAARISRKIIVKARLPSRSSRIVMSLCMEENWGWSASKSTARLLLAFILSKRRERRRGRKLKILRRKSSWISLKLSLSRSCRRRIKKGQGCRSREVQRNARQNYLFLKAIPSHSRTKAWTQIVTKSSTKSSQEMKTKCIWPFTKS